MRKGTTNKVQPFRIVNAQELLTGTHFILEEVRLIIGQPKVVATSLSKNYRQTVWERSRVATFEPLSHENESWRGRCNPKLSSKEIIKAD